MSIHSGNKDTEYRIAIAGTGVHRMLDLLCASAKLYIEKDSVEYRGGQHIRDDTGDNLKQYGLHGSSQAVIGLAAGLSHAGAQSRHRRFLEGGVQWLTS